MHTLTDYQPDTNAAEVECRACHRLFSATLHLVCGRPMHVRLCAKCMEETAVQAERVRLAAREALWLEVCPVEYRQCDPARLPTDEARAALEMARTWNPDYGGWSVVGRASGQGKSRIVHAAAKPHCLAGTSVASVNCADLGLEVAARFDREMRELLKPLRNVGILILDDLGKERADTRVALAFYVLVRHRVETRRPILFTSNYAGDELAERLGEQGPYIVRRLREYCRGMVL